MTKEAKKLEFIDLYQDILDETAKDDLCIDNEEWQKYMDGEWDPYIVFEGDPDYMITPEGSTVYFCIIGSRVYYIGDPDDEYMDALQEFCNGQDPTISRSGYNTRSETKKWQYMDDNTWDGWDNCKKLKIAYRGGCGYIYTLFEYA